MPDNNLEKQVKETYLKMIENSIGTRIFNSLYVKNLTTGKEFDALNDGELSCAFFVSGVLSLLGLLEKPHSTVKTVVVKLDESKKWTEVLERDYQPGDVLVWETVTFDDGSQNEHIGFCLNKDLSISTSYKERCVVRHSIDFEGKRKVVKTYRLN